MKIRGWLVAAVLLATTIAALAGSAGTIIVLDGNGVPRTYDVHIDDTGNFSSTSGPINTTTLNGTVKITTGGTYQQVLASASAGARQSLTIQNNQISGTDVCYLLFGSNVAGQVTPGTTTTATNLTINAVTIPAGGVSLILNPGQAYTRYYPLVPSDAFYATCSTTGDTLYVDTQ